MWKRVHFLFTPTLKEVHISAQWMRTSIKQWRSFCHLITYYVIFIVPYVFLCDWLRSRSGSFWRKKTFSLRTIKMILRLIISLLETLISFSLKLCLARKKIIIWHIFFQIHFPAHYYHNWRGIFIFIKIFCWYLIAPNDGIIGLKQSFLCTKHWIDITNLILQRSSNGLLMKKPDILRKWHDVHRNGSLAALKLKATSKQIFYVKLI